MKVRLSPKRGGAIAHQLGYIPGLDGLRTVAVVTVMLYHAEVSWMPGGFFGVDVFFALSGYLITSLLISEQRRTGKVDLPAFWMRRAKRLLPALFGVLLFVSAFGVWWARDEQLARLRADGLSALFYVANWRLVFSEQSYFDVFSPSPLRHTWSLAIEEQWYLVWPFVASLLLRRKSRASSAPLFILVAALLSAGVMWSLAAGADDTSRAYYGTDARAQTLLLGSALAFFLAGARLSSKFQDLVHVLGLVGAGMLGVVFFGVHDDSDAIYRGGFLLVAAAAVAVVATIIVPGRSVVRKVLETRPMAAIGRISYGLYLWHWPLYVTLTPSRVGFDGARLVGVRLAATFFVSIVSYWLIEIPVRFSTRPRIDLVRAAGVGIACVSVVLLVATKDAKPLEDTFDSIDPGALPPGGMVLDVADDGTVGLVMVGSSVAFDLARDGAQSMPGVAVYNAGIAGCGILDEEAKFAPKPGRDALYQFDRCIGRGPFWAGRFMEKDPEYVVVEMGVYELYDYVVDGVMTPFGTPEWDEFFKDQIRSRIAEIHAVPALPILLNVPCTPDRDFASVQRVNGLVAEVVAEYPPTAGEPRVQLDDINAFVCGTGSEPIGGWENWFYDKIHYEDPAALRVMAWIGESLPPAPSWTKQARGTSTSAPASTASTVAP